MKEYGTVSAETLSAWRAWLRRHHGTEKEVWLVLSKKGSGRPSVSDADAAEEALCWGWIDSILKKVDDGTYMKKFTPRTDTAKWSRVNVERVKALIAAGRMQPAGRAKIPDEVLRADYVSYTEKRPAAVEPPEEFLRALEGDPTAKSKFDALPPSSRRLFIGWILEAKREETRLCRIRKAVAVIAQGKKNLMS